MLFRSDHALGRQDHVDATAGAEIEDDLKDWFIPNTSFAYHFLSSRGTSARF